MAPHTEMSACLSHTILAALLSRQRATMHRTIFTLNTNSGTNLSTTPKEIGMDVPTIIPMTMIDGLMIVTMTAGTGIGIIIKKTYAKS